MKRLDALPRWLRLLGGAVAGQALLSAASLLAGVLLLRATSNEQYGLYVLTASAILLVCALQSAYLGPPLIARLSTLEREARTALLSGAAHEQARLVAATLLAGLAMCAVGLCAGMLPPALALMLVLAAGAAAAALARNFYRLVLQARQRPFALLIGDALFAALTVGGMLLARRANQAAMAAAVSMALASLAASLWSARALRRLEGRPQRRERSVLRSFAPLGLWTTAGAAIHWSFGQGYNFLVVGLLDVSAVAAVAATRTLLMPVNLLSTGMSSSLLPLVTSWLGREDTARVLRRLASVSAVVGLLSAAYFALLWLARDWLFAVVLHKSFAQRDSLLLLWACVVLVAALRDPLLHILVVRRRLAELTALTLASAMAATACILCAAPRWGAAGAVSGVLVGETLNLLGVLTLALREARIPFPNPPPAEAAPALELP